MEMEMETEKKKRKWKWKREMVVTTEAFLSEYSTAVKINDEAGLHLC